MEKLEHADEEQSKLTQRTKAEQSDGYVLIEVSFVQSLLSS